MNIFVCRECDRYTEDEGGRLFIEGREFRICEDCADELEQYLALNAAGCGENCEECNS